MLSDKTVFVIDDDEASALSLQALLSVNRFRVHALYANAEAFLDGYDHKMFGCLVLDVRLSGMSGLERQTERQTELQTELQRRKIDLLIVMISGLVLLEADCDNLALFSLDGGGSVKVDGISYHAVRARERILPWLDGGGRRCKVPRAGGRILAWLDGGRRCEVPRCRSVEGL